MKPVRGPIEISGLAISRHLLSVWSSRLAGIILYEAMQCALAAKVFVTK